MANVHTFTDTAGRAWNVAISLATVRAVKNEHQLDLSRFATDAAVLTAFEDPFRFAGILATILASDMQAAKVSFSDLESALDGDTITAAIFAVCRAIRDFLPEAPRQIADKVVGAMETAERKRIELAGKAIQSGALDAAFDAAMSAADTELDAALQRTA